jgi:hypothetical protein
MRINQILGIIAVLLILGLGFTTYTFIEKSKSLQSDKEALQNQVADLSAIYSQLSDAYKDLSKQKTYSISLAPNVETKVNSTFGSAKQLTFQYYFTMDGNTIGLKPDSTIILKGKN